MTDWFKDEKRELIDAIKDVARALRDPTGEKEDKTDWKLSSKNWQHAYNSLKIELETIRNASMKYSVELHRAKERLEAYDKREDLVWKALNAKLRFANGGSADDFVALHNAIAAVREVKP